MVPPASSELAGTAEVAIASVCVAHQRVVIRRRENRDRRPGAKKCKTQHAAGGGHQLARAPEDQAAGHLVTPRNDGRWTLLLAADRSAAVKRCPFSATVPPKR